MRLRTIRVSDSADVEPGTVPFSNKQGQVNEDFQDGIVVMLGNNCAPDYVTVFNQGVATFYNEDGKFTPRVEDWSDLYVEVLQDDK